MPDGVTAAGKPQAVARRHPTGFAGPAAGRVAIVVAGMHRSGTSLLAHLLTCLGAHLPDKQLGPGTGNVLGHWEPLRLVALNDRILRTLGRSAIDPRPMPAGWRGSRHAEAFVGRIMRRIDEDYGDAPLLVIKDPRLCRLLPLYAAALERLDIDLRVVLCARHPHEVVQSLAARDGTEAAVAGMLWARHVIEAEAQSRPYRRAWTSFDALLGDCEGVAGALGRSLGLPWLAGAGRRGADVAAIARSDQRHWAANDGDPASPFLERIWQAVRRGLAGGEDEARALFDESRALLDEFDRYHQAREQRLEAVYASVSWRLTTPLRRLRRAALWGWFANR